MVVDLPSKTVYLVCFRSVWTHLSRLALVDKSTRVEIVTLSTDGLCPVEMTQIMLIGTDWNVYTIRIPIPVGLPSLKSRPLM